eukprot:TRINITY_DN43727_c0_g1_i1.p1 TRINITY_DN43727_c0_g1~~TRINITY_DN43727_c0_g1_i1.p1  ORF type:complete len:283 (+),score=47.54 TRINITY_DN43727_c0_g1_i1:30-851(+)
MPCKADEPRPIWTFIPVFFVSALQLWVVASYVIFANTNHINNMIVVFCVTLGLVSMVRAVMTDPGHIPETWGVTSANKADIRTLEKKTNKELRVCRRCQVFKPDRSHHCSSCDRCVLKMDHHCPWLNNCVGFRNHKFFLLFVFYTAVGSIYVVTTGGTIFTLCFTLISAPNAPFENIASATNYIFSYGTAFLFACALIPFVTFHIRLVLQNTTTIEFMEKADKIRRLGRGANVYDLGPVENVVMVFGRKPALWLFPVATTLGNGVNWPTSSYV